MPPPLTPEQEAQLVARYQRGDSGSLLGRLYGVSGTVVYGTLRRHGITPRSPSEARRVLSPQQEQFAVRLYQRQWTPKRIAATLGCSGTTVRRALQRHAVPIRTRWDANVQRGQLQLTARQEATIVRRYQRERISMQAVGATLGVSSFTVQRVLQRHGVARRPGGTTGQRKLTSRQEAQVVRRYQQGAIGLNALGAAFGVSGSTIQKILIRHGVARRPVGVGVQQGCRP